MKVAWWRSPARFERTKGIVLSAYALSTPLPLIVTKGLNVRAIPGDLDNYLAFSKLPAFADHHPYLYSLLALAAMALFMRYHHRLTLLIALTALFILSSTSLYLYTKYVRDQPVGNYW